MVTEGKTTYNRIFRELNPMNETIFYKAGVYQTNGEFSIALQLYREIIEKEPDNSKALQGIADVYCHMGNHKEALNWYNKALDNDPKNPEIWYNKGLTLRKMGHQEEGLSCIRKGFSFANESSFTPV
ncbi:MAG: tetratricopeptide repeat protein [Methanomicrobiales archaeon]|mgnify:CR=1 FL=1|nr:tetratricopeptide repeat protein [Methanomicrobiales archaeon]